MNQSSEHLQKAIDELMPLTNDAPYETWGPHCEMLRDELARAERQTRRLRLLGGALFVGILTIALYVFARDHVDWSLVAGIMAVLAGASVIATGNIWLRLASIVLLLAAAAGLIHLFVSEGLDPIVLITINTAILAASIAERVASAIFNQLYPAPAQNHRERIIGLLEYFGYPSAMDAEMETQGVNAELIRSVIELERAHSPVHIGAHYKRVLEWRQGYRCGFFDVWFAASRTALLRRVDLAIARWMHAVPAMKDFRQT